MKSILKKPVLTVAIGLAAGLTAVKATPVQAVTFDFDVLIDSGLLSGQAFSGSFSFDEAGLTGVGSELLPVSDLQFNFLGTPFTEASDSPEVEFSDGEFLGLDFAANNNDVSFTFVPGFLDISEAEFVYVPATGTSGFGNVTFAEQPPSVPEPTAMASLVTLAVLGSRSLLKRQAVGRKLIKQ